MSDSQRQELTKDALKRREDDLRKYTQLPPKEKKERLDKDAKVVATYIGGKQVHLDRRPADLFRRHVRGRPEEHAGGREVVLSVDALHQPGRA